MAHPLQYLRFLVKGREAGFAFRDIRILRRVAAEQRLEHPAALFWSVDQLDRSLKRLINRAAIRVDDMDPRFARLLGLLLGLRQRIELKQSQGRHGLRSTRRLVSRQLLHLSRAGETAVFSSVVLENRERYFAVSYPQGPRTPDGYSWKGRQVAVTANRPGDACYWFGSRVLEDFSAREYPILHIAHTESVQREQRRLSIRVETDLPAQLYPGTAPAERGDAVEMERGVTCRLVDLSEGGCALLVGGRARVGMPVKVQFVLGQDTIAMCGIVRGCNTHPGNHTSLLHVQARSLTPPQRARILTYVFDYLGERPKGGPRAPGSSALAEATRIRSMTIDAQLRPAGSPPPAGGEVTPANLSVGVMRAAAGSARATEGKGVHPDRMNGNRSDRKPDPG